MKTVLRSSRVLKKLRGGEVASCVKINLADPRVVEIAAMSGIDSVWLDLEHVPNTLREIENCVRAAKMHDCDPLVRIARGSYSDVVQPLEMDAAGIMVPHVMSAADAAQVARQARFHPVGLRPLDGGNADGAYCTVETTAYMAHANEQRFVIVQIEDRQPLAELDQIAATPGVDMLFFGPGDFSQSIGAPGNFSHPELLDARREVAKAAQRHGKFAGTVSAAATLNEVIDQGYRFVSIGADVVALTQYFSQIAATFTPPAAPTSTAASPYRN